MISRRCCWLFLWLLILINLVGYPVCQARRYPGDRQTRELTTVYPEIPQRDMSSQRPQIPETDPCYRFSIADFEKMQFFSPGFADQPTYPNNTDCVLVLEAPSGYLIKLDFRDHFRIEPSPKCTNDFLEVRDGLHGYNKQIEGNFCGFDFPPIITSSDRYLWIHFKSDDNIEYEGFRAVFEYIPRPETLKTPESIQCHDNVTGDEGVIGKTNISQEIVDFTRKNHMPLDCIWAIVVRDKWRIQLQFEKFDLEKPNECDKNFVEVFSGRTDIPSREKQFCGSIADTVLSAGNIMYVRFFADDSVPKSAFRANFTAFRQNDDKSPGNYNQGCKEDEFDCEDTTCISKDLQCNGRYNCRFRWDEDECPTSILNTQALSLTANHIVIIMVIFTLILSGMCFTFIFNCVKKLMRDHHTIQEYIRQSREQQLNELDKQEGIIDGKKLSRSISRSRSNSSRSSGSPHFDIAANASANTPCYVPGGELLPILIRNEHSTSPSNGDAYHQQNIYTVDNENLPEMCDSACQTRESLFTTQAYSSGNSTPNHSVHTNSPPAPFSTFGYKKDNNNKFKAEAKIEMTAGNRKKFDEKRRPYSVQTTKSAPDVIVTH